MYGRADIEKLNYLKIHRLCLIINQETDGKNESLTDLVKQFRGKRKEDIQSWESDYDKTPIGGGM